MKTIVSLGFTSYFQLALSLVLDPCSQIYLHKNCMSTAAGPPLVCQHYRHGACTVDCGSASCASHDVIRCDYYTCRNSSTPETVSQLHNVSGLQQRCGVDALTKQDWRLMMRTPTADNTSHDAAAVLGCRAYVTHYDGSLVHELDLSTGDVTHSWSLPLATHHPQGLTYVPQRGTFLVGSTDTSGTVGFIFEFNPQQKSLPVTIFTTGFVDAEDIIVMPNNVLVVLDQSAHKVHIVNLLTRLVTSSFGVQNPLYGCRVTSQTFVLGADGNDYLTEYNLAGQAQRSAGYVNTPYGVHCVDSRHVISTDQDYNKLTLCDLQSGMCKDYLTPDRPGNQVISDVSLTPQHLIVLWTNGIVDIYH